MRTFISVELPQEIKNKIAELISEFKELAANIKWVKPENLHITLKFLGEIDERQLDNLITLTTKAIASLGSFKVKFVGLGTFPSGKSPKVIWVGTEEGGDRLCDLVTVLEQNLVKADFKIETREFKPHITIARLKDMKGVDKILKKTAQFKEIKFGQVLLDSIYIMKSTLTPKGPIYQNLKEIKL